MNDPQLPLGDDGELAGNVDEILGEKPKRKRKSKQVPIWQRRVELSISLLLVVTLCASIICITAVVLITPPADINSLFCRITNTCPAPTPIIWVATPGPQPTTPPRFYVGLPDCAHVRETGSERVVFMAELGDHSRMVSWELFIMDADGSNRCRLTDNDIAENFPTWSPDGTRIAFTTNREGNSGAYISMLRWDGSHFFDVTSVNAANFESHQLPDWSPDGDYLVFQILDTRTASIFSVNIDGTNMTKLSPDTEVFDYAQPTWSPDAEQIAFTSDRDTQDIYLNNHDIYIMNRDGSDIRRLTNGGSDNVSPSWSPDSQSILFLSGKSQEPHGMYVMATDGSNVQRVGDMDATLAKWSTDGTKIYFLNTHSLYIMNADGSHVERITQGFNIFSFDVWQPPPIAE